MPSVADVFAQNLVEAGVEVVFGLPGGEVVAVLDAVRRHNIQFVLVHNESSAVFMADSLARVSGKPGVVLTTLGPGAANAVAGVAHAYLDRAPVLIVTAQTPQKLQDHHSHQFIDLQALYTPITKASAQLQPAGAAETIRAALALLQNGRPGPVHLSVSSEDATQTATAGPSAITSVISQPFFEADKLDETRLQQAVQLLGSAERPVILAGLGLEPERPYALLQTLAEATQAPVITTPKGKGAIPADHPLAAGTLGLTRTDPVYEILDEADCILAVGFDVVELVKPWDQSASLIWLAPWANDAPPIAADVELVGTMTPVLQRLSDATFVNDPAWGAKRVATFHKTLNGNLGEPRAERMHPQTVFEAVRQAVPADTLVAVDVGSHKILGSLNWPSYRPNRFFVSNGLSCMGFSLPTTIAASLGLGKQSTVCFTGDAGLAMVIGELALLRTLGTPVIVVVFNDAALDLIRSHQNRVGFPTYGTEFTTPDFVQLAAAYGLAARRVTTEAACLAAVQSAVASGQPALIEAMIDPAAYPTTPKQKA